jgi:hypothetical protein
MIALANRPGGFDETHVSLLEPLTTGPWHLDPRPQSEDERSHMERVLRFNAEHDFSKAAQPQQLLPVRPMCCSSTSSAIRPRGKPVAWP